MKNFVVIILVLLFSVSCKKELVKEPKKLIEKEKMVDIMYDLAILEAMRYQNPLSLDSIDSNQKRFVLNKDKVDSLQFAQSNIYYAADYDTYKEMFDEVSKRIAVQQRATDSIVKIEEKKAAKANKNKANPGPAPKLNEEKRKSSINLDSIRRAMHTNK